MSRQLWALVFAKPISSLLLVSVILFVPGVFALPTIDRDESQYAQMSAQMIETGNFLEPKFQEAPSAAKPVGMYWVRAAFVSLFSSTDAREIWPYRLPSVLSAVLVVLFTFWGGRKFFDDKVAFVGAVLCGASLMLLGESTLAKTDAALAASVAAAQFAMGLVYVRAKRGQLSSLLSLPGAAAFVFWIAVSLGTLFKGPVAPGIAGFTIIGLIIVDRDIRWIKGLSPIWGILIAAIIMLPWFIAILQTTYGSAYLSRFFFDEVARNIISGYLDHAAPTGYYLALAGVLFWPGSLFLIPAGIFAWRHKLEPATRFCLAWIVPSWIFFELTTTKLPYYLIPLYPAMGLLCAKWIFEVARQGSDRAWLTKVVWIGIGYWLVSSFAVAIVPAALDVVFGDGLTVASVAIALLTMGLSLAGVRLLTQGRPILSAGVVVAAVAVFNFFIQQVQLPGLTALHISPAMVEALERHAPDEKQSVRIVGYSEPSLVFLLGTDTHMTTFRQAAAYISQKPGGAVFVEQRHLENFLGEVERRGIVLEERETISGFNYTRGTNLSLTLFKSKN